VVHNRSNISSFPILSQHRTPHWATSPYFYHRSILSTVAIRPSMRPPLIVSRHFERTRCSAQRLRVRVPSPLAVAPATGAPASAPLIALRYIPAPGATRDQRTRMRASNCTTADPRVRRCQGPPRALALSRGTLLCAAPAMPRSPPSYTSKPPPPLSLPPKRSGHRRSPH
jgi:hypothetical protein